MKSNTKENQDVRQAMKNAGIFHWEVAEVLEISENTLVRRLRRELPTEAKQQIYEAIESIKRNWKTRIER